MKKLNLSLLLFLCCFLFSCQPKKEKKQPVIDFKIQNYKYDDDELEKKKTNDSKDKKHTLDDKKSDIAPR